jgi:hypothetical protein
MPSEGFKRFTPQGHVPSLAVESHRQPLVPAGGIHRIDVAGGAAALPAWSTYGHRRTSHYQNDAAAGLLVHNVPPGTNVELAFIHRHATNALATTSFVRVWALRSAGKSFESLVATPVLEVGLTSGGPLVIAHDATNPPTDLVPILATPPAERFVDEISITSDFTLQPGAEILGGSAVGGISMVVFDPCGASQLLIVGRVGTAESLAVLIGGV